MSCLCAHTIHIVFTPRWNLAGHTKAHIKGCSSEILLQYINLLDHLTIFTRILVDREANIVRVAVVHIKFGIFRLFPTIVLTKTLKNSVKSLLAHIGIEE